MTAKQKWAKLSPDEQKWAMLLYKNEISREAVNRLEKFNAVAMILKDMLKTSYGKFAEGGYGAEFQIIYLEMIKHFILLPQG